MFSSLNVFYSQCFLLLMFSTLNVFISQYFLLDTYCCLDTVDRYCSSTGITSRQIAYCCYSATVIFPASLSLLDFEADFITLSLNYVIHFVFSNAHIFCFYSLSFV